MNLTVTLPTFDPESVFHPLLVAVHPRVRNRLIAVDSGLPCCGSEVRGALLAAKVDAQTSRIIRDRQEISIFVDLQIRGLGVI